MEQSKADVQPEWLRPLVGHKADRWKDAAVYIFSLYLFKGFNSFPYVLRY